MSVCSGVANAGVGAAVVAGFDEVPGIRLGGQRVRSAGPEATGINRRERGYLRKYLVDRLCAAAAIGLEFARRWRGGTAVVVHRVAETVIGAQGEDGGRSGFAHLHAVILGS